MWTEAQPCREPTRFAMSRTRGAETLLCSVMMSLGFMVITQLTARRVDVDLDGDTYFVEERPPLRGLGDITFMAMETDRA